MKKTVLYLGTALLLYSLSTSCVSKRKFEDLARAKRESDRSLVEMRQEKDRLEKELEMCKDEFNDVRYRLTGNNAEKDKTIDGLYSRLRSLESKQVELKSELSNAADRIRTSAETSSEQISSLENSLRQLTAERDRVRKEADDLQGRLQFENQSLKSRLETAGADREACEAELKKLKEANTEYVRKLEWIRKKKAEGDAEIRKLTNQVNLLKKELSK